MQSTTFILALCVFAFFAYQIGIRRSVAVVQGKVDKLHSLPSYHGYFSALSAVLPALLVFGVWSFFESTVITNMVLSGLAAELPGGYLGGYLKVTPNFRQKTSTY